MNTKNLSSILLRLLVILALVISLALGTISPVNASSFDVAGWGQNTYGVLTIPNDLTGVVAISAGYSHSLALKSDRTVIAWGCGEPGGNRGQCNMPSGLSDVIAIVAGESHSLALKSDGTVVGWGYNANGQTNIPSDLTNVTAIAAGAFHSLALKSDGTVEGWGGNSSGQTNIPSDLTNVTAIAAGTAHSLALTSDGTVEGWGLNNSWQINIPSGLANVTAISAGFFHSLALTSDGTVIAWGCGSGDYGQCNVPGELSDVIAIAAGRFHSLALKSDGTVVGWGYNANGQTTIPSGLTGVVAIAAGNFHNLALVLADNPANTAPVANPGGPYLGAVNTAIQFDGSGSSDADGDPLTYAWTFGDDGTATDVMPMHSYMTAGIYNACLTVNDGTVDSDSVCTLTVVYDPSAGFVTGGGWLNSPAGAFKYDETLSGQATFGFVARYQKGASLPTGNTAFKFDLAGMEFASNSYEWLVVNQGNTNAQFKGSGLINGLADDNGNAYKFILWAGDGKSTNSADTFRIRIWSEDATGEEQVVYDNDTNQAIGAGNIVVHTVK